MTGNIKNIIIFKGGSKPQDEMWYINQVIPAVGLSMDKLSGAHIDINYVSYDHLDQAYIMGYVMASGHDLNNCTLTPFNDRDGGNGIVVKVFEQIDEKNQSDVATMTDDEMINKIIELAKYYANGGLSADNPKLVNEVIEIGKTLDQSGGISEMRRIFNKVPQIQGKRTVEMQWDGIGDWYG